MSLTRFLAGLAGGGTLVGVALTGYAACEARAYTLRRFKVPALPVGARPLKVLHLSDVHMLPDQKRKQEWLSGLATLRPDLVVNTGDNLSHRASVPTVCDSFGPLLDVPGVFVFGSNDYFSPSVPNPFRYLLPDDGKRRTDTEVLPWRDLRDRFGAAGWTDLTNRRDSVKVGDLTLAFAGVDDPHLGYDRLEDVAGPAELSADLRLGVAHAPYLRVLDQFAADGYDGILAGHTHGGQVCLPGGRALTTNCDLDRPRAKGLHRHPSASSADQAGSSWLHVSAGLGTSPFARLRIACRPEASLITLVARS